MTWWRATTKQRAALPASCFLLPGARKYIICPRRTHRPTCDGVLAARRRAILTHNYEAEVRAIRRARLLGCPWGSRAQAKVRIRRRRAA
jgi:hypothetical protein